MIMNNDNKKQGGYIALMATIVISLVLLVVAAEESSSGWFARFNILGTEAKEQASALAEGCAEQAQASLLTDPTYGYATTTITTSGGTCSVFPVAFNSLNGIPTLGYLTIKTQAEVRNSYANLELAMNMNDIHLNSIPAAPTTGTLFITTHVVNDSSGLNQAGDFTINVSANPSSSFAGSESGTVVTVQPGIYSVNGSSLPNYSRIESSGCSSGASGDITAGEIRFCTITYDDITTTLTVLANVVNNDTGTKQPSDFPLFIDGVPVTLGQATTITAGTHTVSATLLSGYASSAWGYDCSAGGNITMTLGQNKTCIVNFDDIPPPTPVCAETVMMLDRTGSMASADLTNERNAAIAFTNLYSTVTPAPKVGVGSFGGLYGSTAAQVPDNTHPYVGWLTTIYTTITNAITQITGSNSSVGTDLSAAITAGNAELNSSRHVAGKEQVLVIVSDGEPNEPNDTTNTSTDFESPSVNAQNASGELWSNPTNAYTDGAGDASDPVSENDRHRFYNFGFGGGSGLSSNATVRGIEVKTDAWATTNPTNGTITLAPSSLGAFTSWSPNTGTAVAAVTTNDTGAYITPAPQQESFVFAGAGISSGSTITSVTLHAVALGSGGSIQLLEENGGSQILGPTVNLNSNYVDYSYSFPTMPNGSSWTLAEVNAWTTKFGVINVSGTTARVTQMYVVVGYTTSAANNIQKAPASASSPNQWSNPSNAFASDNSYATDTTNGHQQGYSNFGFTIPAGATITGIQVTTEAKISGTVTSLTTATLFPNGQGNYTSWNGDESDIDETGTPDCSSSDSITENNSNDRESVNLDLSSIPNGATITDVSITAYDRGDSSSGGTYKTFVRLDGSNSDASSNLSATGTSGCNAKTQSINFPDTVKSGSTDFEVGVVKVSGNNNTVRVGAIRAVVTYIPSAVGSLGVALSSNNGGSWTSVARDVSLTASEAVLSPSGNSSSDMWGRSWVSSDFNNGNFVLRVQNNSTSGITASLDQVIVNVFYAVLASQPPITLAPSSLGAFTSWSPNTGTAVAAVTTNDTGAYITPAPQQESFVFAGAGISSGSTITSVTLHAVALGSGGSIQLLEENGGSQILGPTVNLNSNYVDYSYSFPTMPNGSSWTLAEVNAWTTKFGVINVSGTTARVTQMYVVVNYTTSGPTACQLGVDLSWNGSSGSPSWTSEKTQTLNGTETSYTLGSPTDDWTSSHTWTYSEFSNGNFRARVRAIDPGSGCDNSAVDHLDWLQVKVYYSQPTDPTAAAYAAADAAKLAGTDIFTIHFGDTAGRDLLAKLASGTTPNSPHQNGSYFDAGGVVNGDTGNIAPSQQATDTGGDGNGFEVNPTYSYTDNDAPAANMDGAADRHRYYGYNIVLPPNATVTGISVSPNWWLDSTSGTNSLSIELSYNGGANWTSSKSDTGESTSHSHSATLGGSGDTWGRTWSATDFSQANFRVRVTSNSTSGSRDFYLDYLPVRVYYSVIQENDDGDNFFISPTSADMEDIFHFIGEKVCPAILNVAPPPPPTTGTLLVMTQVVNNNDGSKVASDFTVNVSADTPSQSSFAGSATGVLITVNPGSYSITENNVNGYTLSPGATCSSAGSLGPIVAGEMRVCIITNDDIPPPPPPPTLNLDLNSWHEIPTAQ